MSAESATLVLLQEINSKVDRLAAAIAAASPTPWPDRLKTSEAVTYVRHAHRRPEFSASTLYRWLAAGRLTDVARPRRWLREELDACCCGTPIGSETRGARRRA